eukprot:3770431-Rhodomonas_salina.1
MSRNPSPRSSMPLASRPAGSFCSPASETACRHSAHGLSVDGLQYGIGLCTVLVGRLVRLFDAAEA